MRLSDEELSKLTQPGPAYGRAEFVSPVSIIPDPSKYHGKRVILAGIWTAGFEHSMLDLENNAQDFGIWVDADWSKIDQPMGDFSRQRDKEVATLDQNGHVAHHIVAEGTFYYRKAHLAGGIPGFGHMGVSDAYFLIDRLFRFDPSETRVPKLESAASP